LDADRFIFNVGDGHDVITDFSAGDTLELTGYGQVQSITQNGGDVLVTFSADDQVTFLNTDVATVQAGIVFPPTDDWIIGTPGNDTLNGYAAMMSSLAPAERTR
jgi:Ca2+-binding RTX toxin-like protein